MTAASGKQYAVGARHAIVYALNSDGRPNATATTYYEGLELTGPKAVTLNVPEPRRIDHYGADRVLAVDWLPPNEGVTGEIRVAKEDLDVDALVSGVVKFSFGEATMLVGSSDQQGDEPDVGILCFQQSLDASTKTRKWRFFIIPSARLVALPGGMDENPVENRYAVAASPTTKHLWGEAMEIATEGALEAAYVRGMSNSKPHIVAFLGDNAEDEFLFPTAKQASTVDNVTVWVDGVEQTSGITVAVTGVTFTTPPGTGADIVVLYEYD